MPAGPSHRGRCAALVGLLAALLALGVMWQSHLASNPGHRDRAIQLTEVGNRRVFETLTALGRLAVSATGDAFDQPTAEGPTDGLLGWTLRASDDRPLPSTILARRALGSDSDFDVVSVAIDPRDWTDPDNGLKANPFGRGKDWERGACVSLLEAGKLVTETTAGIRIHGGSSRGQGQTSLRLILSPLYGAPAEARELLLPGSKGTSLVLHNDRRALHFVNPIAYTLAAELGCHVPKTRPVRLLVNGVEQNAVFFLTQHLGRPYLRERLGHDRFLMFNEKGDRKPKPYRVIRQRVLRNSPSLMVRAAEDVDIADVVNWLTTILLCGTCDARQGMAYRDEADPNGRWRWILWDLDWSFQPWRTTRNGEPDEDGSVTAYLLHKWCLRTTLFGRLMRDDPAFRVRFLARISSALNHELRPARLQEILGRYRDIAKTYATEGYERTASGLDQIETFLAERPERLRAELIDHFDIGPVFDCSVSPTVGLRLSIDGHAYAEIYNGRYFAGQTLHLAALGGQCEWRVNGSSRGTSDAIELVVDGELRIEAIAQ